MFGGTIVPEIGNEIGQVNIRQRLDYERAHQILGHPGRNKLIGTTERLHWHLNEKHSESCEDCLKGKAKRLNINKESKNNSTKPGERLMIDTSSIKTKNNKKVGRFWLLVVDEATDMKWTFFLKNKDDQVKILVNFVKNLKEIGKKVRYIRCDNAGENLSLQKAIDDEGLNVKFEYTARNTPQQNGKVERAFATLYGRMRAMMISAKFDATMKQQLWMEAAATATKLDNILCEKNKKSPYFLFHNENPEYEKYLRTFGEYGIVTTNPGGTIRSKLEDRGITCMFLGYAANHAGNVYRMLNMKTKQVLITRDVKWLNTYEKDTKKNELVHEIEDDDLNILPTDTEPEKPVQEDELDDENNNEVEDNEETIEFYEEPKRPRLMREIQNLQPYNNPGRIEMEGETNHFCFFVPESVNNDDDDTPTTFQEAWHHENPEKREKWRNAIRLEFKQMIKNGVWRNEGLKFLPRNRKGIGTKWVFKQKKNGVYRARLVVKGYDQVAGIDFQYNFAPVTSEITLRILLILWIIEDYYVEVADVQTAFLYGELEEEIYIKIPDGYYEFLKEEKKKLEGKFLKLEKSTYGLVQAARAWWKKFTSKLKKELGFQQYENDSCLLKRENSDGRVFLIIYVDDCFFVGDKEAVQKALNDIEEIFKITRSTNVDDFIGCKIERQGNQILLSQPDLINKMIKQFGNKIDTLREYETPAPTSTHIIRCNSEEEGLTEEEQQEYRSGVGSLLYLIKHSRPELSNSVRELSKTMDKANKYHQKALYRAIKFVQATKTRQLILKPEQKELTWELKGYCDSDFAGDSETRKSVSGFVIYLCGAVIAWRSKGQRSVSLSSTEAEYMAISEVATEILYVAGILKFLGIPLKYPIIVNVDNIGAVYLTKNATTGNRTKHIDTRYHFVREYIEDGILKVKFVRSEKNHADLFTKNLNKETFKRHCDAIGLDDMHDSACKMANRKGVTD